MNDQRAGQLRVEEIRDLFPGLHRGWTLFDNAGGSQILQPVVDRMQDYFARCNVQLGGSYDLSKAAADAVRQGRSDAATLVNAARPEEVVFGPSTTVLLQNLARAMRSQFSPGDEIIVTSLDHESNIGPWEKLEEDGVVIKFWHLDPQTLRLDLEDLAKLLGNRTKLVCVTHVSNVLGSINPIERIAKLVHGVGARLCVDGVAFAPHRAIDVRAMDVDYYVFSLYKAFGPHGAVLYGRHAHLLELDSLNHYFYGRDNVPAKLEPGNPNYEVAYAVTAIVDYLCQLGRERARTIGRRESIEAGFEAIALQEETLAERLLSYLRNRRDCMIFGQPGAERSERVSTISFRFVGRDSGEICSAMDGYKIAIRFGDFHARRLGDRLGFASHNGAIRVSMLHYNTLEEVERLTAAFDQILGAPKASSA